MPRHRKERGPRRGALRRESGSRRGVLARLPDHEPAFGRQASRAIAPGERRPRVRLVRSLLATPWFAAGAGIVIAAALAVDSPTALTYAPSDPGGQCPVHGCTSPPGQPAEPATASPGVTLQAPGMKAKQRGTVSGSQHGRVAPGDRVGYQVVRRWHSGFVAVMTVPESAKPGRWRLRFAFPAAHVDHVWGAQWHPSGSGAAGTAEGPARWPGHARGTSGLEAGQVMVSATGRPTAPSGCHLNGVACHFG
jgi:hypothetical protein